MRAGSLKVFPFGGSLKITCCILLSLNEHVWSSITVLWLKQPSLVLARKADTFVAAIALNTGCGAVVTRSEGHFRWIG
jgi:hypothetical protein